MYPRGQASLTASALKISCCCSLRSEPDCHWHVTSQRLQYSVISSPATVAFGAKGMEWRVTRSCHFHDSHVIVCGVHVAASLVAVAMAVVAVAVHFTTSDTKTCAIHFLLHFVYAFPSSRKYQCSIIQTTPPTRIPDATSSDSCSTRS